MSDSTRTFNPITLIRRYIERLYIEREIKVINRYRSICWRRFNIALPCDRTLSESEIGSLRTALVNICLSLRTAESPADYMQRLSLLETLAVFCDELTLFGEDAEDIKAFGMREAELASQR